MVELGVGTGRWELGGGGAGAEVASGARERALLEFCQFCQADQE